MSRKPPTRRFVQPRATFCALTFTRLVFSPRLPAACTKACAADSLTPPVECSVPTEVELAKPIFQRWSFFAGTIETVIRPAPLTTFRPPKDCWKVTACPRPPVSFESATRLRSRTEASRKITLCFASQLRAATGAVAPAACFVR